MSGAMATVTPIKPRIDARHAEEETDAQGRPRRDSGLPPRPIRVLVADDEREIRLALTYLVKGCSVEEIVQAIKRTAEGEATLSAQVTTHVVSDLARELKRNRRQWRRREELIERIKRVIEGHDLAMHYQPVVCLDDGHVI